MTTKKVGYRKELKDDEQIGCEERIAAEISNLSEGEIDEETCAQIGRDALYIVLSQFRPDLMEGQIIV